MVVLFLPGFQGTAVMWLLDVETIDHEMSMDASMSGAGGMSGHKYYRVSFPIQILTEKTKIHHLELWTVILAVRVWGRNMTGKIIRIKSDNEAVTQIINTGRSKDLLLQKLLRELTWWLSIHQFRIKSMHLMGKDNRIPDILSRWEDSPHLRQQFIKLGGGAMKRKYIEPDYFRFTHNW